MRPVRYHPRLACDIPVAIYSPAARVKICEGRLHNIGLAGVGVACAHLSKGMPYEFRFPVGERELRLVGRVAWEAQNAPKNARMHRYGIGFNMSAAQEILLRQALDELRGLGAALVGGAKDYWRA